MGESTGEDAGKDTGEDVGADICDGIGKGTREGTGDEGRDNEGIGTDGTRDDGARAEGTGDEGSGGEDAGGASRGAAPTGSTASGVTATTPAVRGAASDAIGADTGADTGAVSNGSFCRGLGPVSLFTVDWLSGGACVIGGIFTENGIDASFAEYLKKARSLQFPPASRESVMPSTVTEIPAADPAVVAAHYAARLSFETDCWDVHHALTTGVADFVLVDVRGPQLFETAHVPGAINLPHGKMTERKMGEWPEDTLFVVYCAGPHCNGTDRAALRLGRLGRRVKVMIGGMTGWADEGFSVATGR